MSLNELIPYALALGIACPFFLFFSYIWNIYPAISEKKLQAYITDFKRNIPDIKILLDDVVYDLGQSTLITELSTKDDRTICYLFKTNRTGSFFLVDFYIGSPGAFSNRVTPLTTATLKSMLTERQDLDTYKQLFGEPQVL